MNRNKLWLIGLFMVLTLAGLRQHLALRSRLIQVEQDLQTAEGLRAEIQILRQLLDRQVVSVRELERLRKEAADVHRLRAQTSQMRRLQAENEELREHLNVAEQANISLQSQLVQRSAPETSGQPTMEDLLSEFWRTRADLKGVGDAKVRKGTFSPDGKFVVNAGADESARIWDAKTGRPITLPSDAQSETDSTAPR